MQSQKISISLSPTLINFIEYYQEATGCPSPSDVISQALSLLQMEAFTQAYREASLKASLEIDEDWESLSEMD